MRPPHYRRNFMAFLGDYIGFGLGVTFVSSTTVLPDFASQLTDSAVVIGLLSAVGSGAWLLPQLVYARWLTNKRRKKPYVLSGAALGRPFFLLYAAALWLGLADYPTVALVLLFAQQILFWMSDALAAVAWFDVLGKAIPEDRRGRLVGVAQATRGVLAVGAGVIIGTLLGEVGPPFPYNYAALFALAGGWLLFALFSWSFVVEPDEPVEEERSPWRAYLPQLLKTLRQDRAFRRLLVVRLLAGVDTMAFSFYILFATGELGLAPETVGVFTAVQTVGSILASVGLGIVSERRGTHRVIQMTTALSLTAPLVGLGLFLGGISDGSLTVVIYAWVFLVLGAVQGAIMLGFFNYLLELAPAGQRPNYVGLFNTISGVLVLLPPVGGWLLQTTSYGVLFGLTTAVLVVAHVLSWGLPPGRSISASGRGARDVK